MNVSGGSRGQAGLWVHGQGKCAGGTVSGKSTVRSALFFLYYHLLTGSPKLL